MNIFGGTKLRKPAIANKALTYLTPGAEPSFTYSKLETPLKPNELLVHVQAASINPLDSHLIESALSWTVPGEKGIGRDFAGTIKEVGSNLTQKWSVGESVCGLFLRVLKNGPMTGTLSTYIVVDVNVDAVTRIPEKITIEEAAAWPLTFGTAFRSLSYAKLDCNSHVCILGGSTAVGLFAIQLAKNYFKVAKIVVTCSSGFSEELCKSLGADVTVDYRAMHNVADALLLVVNDTMPGKKFNVIVDCVGGKDILNHWKALLEPSTMGSAYVTLVGDSPTDKDTSHISVGGPTAYLTNPIMIGRKLTGAFTKLNYIVESVAPGEWINIGRDLISRGQIMIIVDSVYPWTQYHAAFEKLNNRKAHGKIVLRVEDF
ncbi:GroES-like protein [Nadsonia fulvescens var. elongata DSM 6958]|uniref:GroES-like protein n=1 Tax=Nadsonia fulvescens var. elongata DSM 6958 TaxID=857566 RepID=A0A1E3PMV1_9ASCO|nr:GroES-like protein [Nadsonia fulvescens var. elongata DSM 6958]